MGFSPQISDVVQTANLGSTFVVRAASLRKISGGACSLRALIGFYPITQSSVIPIVRFQQPAKLFGDAKWMFISNPKIDCRSCVPRINSDVGIPSMMNAFASFARRSSTGVRLKSDALPMADTSCAVPATGATQDRISGSIREPRWFPISLIQTGGAL